MPNLICTNQNCSENNKPVFYHKLRLVVDDKGNSKPLRDVFCSNCGIILVLEQNTVIPTEISVGINSFKSMPADQKKEMLNKRAKRNYETQHKKQSIQKREEIIKTIKQSVENP